MSVLRWFLVVFLVMMGATQALAQSCAIPPRLPEAQAKPQPMDDVRTGAVSRYTLALSWSPQYCRTRGSSDPLQCGRDNRFGFILHGLWPDGDGRNYLAWCLPAQPVPASVVRQTFCATPSVQLQQHEWAKHGTCMTDDPARYFKAGTALYNAFRWPDMDGLSRVRPTVGAFKSAFAAANRGVRQDMMYIDTSNGGWLEEVKVCLDRDFRPTRCPKGAGGAPDRQQLRIWRAER
jgi:ribonuclease T2